VRGKYVLEADDTIIEDYPVVSPTHFRRIRPGESLDFEATSESGIETVLPRVSLPATLRPGHYVMQAFVRARLAEVEPSKELRNAERAVLPRLLASGPLPFSVSSEPRLQHCN
jgi:hypothetical protein